MELLRLVAMFLVLVVHADFFSLSAPTVQEVHAAPLPSVARFFFESLSIVCVNVFVLLSGWFGIRPSWRGFGNFIFQCLFFLIGIYIVMLAFGQADLTLRGIAGCFVLLKWNWFIKAYIGLYILAPLLNAFVEKSGERELRHFLVAFYIFQTIYAWLSNGASFVEGGYSTFSFIGLYLLARYFNIYRPKVSSYPPIWDFLIYLFLTAALTFISYISTSLGFEMIAGRMYSYVNPAVILSALYLLLFFSKLKFHNKVVNWLSASSFAIFLLHTNPNLCEPYYVSSVRFIYDKSDGFLCVVYLFLFSVGIAVCAILLDQIRKFAWTKISGFLNL